MAAIFAVWSILATIQFIIVSTILLGTAAAVAFLVLPQARSAAKLFFTRGKDAADVGTDGRRRSNMVIDIEPDPVKPERDPDVSKAYKDLDDELDRFDQDLRKRRL